MATPGRQVTRERLEALLCCPRCKGTLAWGASNLACSSCGASYPIRSGDITVFDLYVDSVDTGTNRDPEQTWSRPGFEKGYERTGYHECGAEFDSKLGYPPEVSWFLFERVKKRLLDWVEPGEGHVILDVGCGAGYFLALIRKKYEECGHSPLVTGVDISEFQLSYMVERMRREDAPDVVAATANGEFLPFASESFDLVTCSEVIEHIQNPVQALREMRRVLKPNGRLLLSTPSMTAQRGWGVVLSPFAAVVKAFRPRTSSPKPTGYEIPWYPKEFQEAIRSAGLVIEAFEQNAVIPHPWYFRFLPRLLVKPVVVLSAFADRFLKFVLRPLALHFVVRASRNTAVRALLLVALIAIPTTLCAQQNPEDDATLLRPYLGKSDEFEAWMGQDYYDAENKQFTQALLGNVERNHLGSFNFWKAYNEGRLEYATGDLKYCLNVFPNHPKALYLMGVLSRQLQNISMPIPMFERAIELFPYQAPTHALYGDYLISVGATNAGIQELEEALRLNPDLLTARASLAKARKRAAERASSH